VRSTHLLSDAAIAFALIACFWYASARAPRSHLLAGQAVILLFITGYAFHLASWSLAGVTFDTYLHLTAAFSATLLLLDRFETRHAALWAGLLVFALGIGVEVVELLQLWLLKEPLTHAYVLDTLKDLLNDALGIAFALLP